MQEDEIKLHVPDTARKAIIDRLRALAGPRRQRMCAIYFDTPDGALGTRRAALRVRLEGRRWVQTFKMEGASLLSRLELNHERPGPEPDLTLYRGTPAEPVLSTLQDRLGARYETDFYRLRREVHTRFGTLEVAYDAGVIRAGTLEMPLYEVEFERVSGQTRAVFDLARQWVREYGLVLDLRSKAERGDGLARIEAEAMQAPVEQRASVREQALARLHAAPGMRVPDLSADVMAAEPVLEKITGACFVQIARNAALLAMAGKLPGAPGQVHEYVDQLHDSLGRLRAMWRLFDGLADLPAIGVRLQARAHARRLEEMRQHQRLMCTLLPALQRAGMPPVELPRSPDTDDPAAIVGSPDFQVWLLDLMAWSTGERASAAAARMTVEGLGQGARIGDHDPDPPASQAAAPKRRAGAHAEARDNKTGNAGGDELAAAMSAPTASVTAGENLNAGGTLEIRLAKWHKRLVRAARRVAAADEAAWDALRRQVERLLDGSELVASWQGGKRLKRYRRRLVKLHWLLNERHSLVAARTRLGALVEAQPQAWFACGWMTARLEKLEPRIQKVLRKLPDTFPAPRAKS